MGIKLKDFQGNKLKGIHKTIECKFSKYVMKLEVGVWWMKQDQEQVQGWKEEKLDNIIKKIGYFHTNIYHYLMSSYHFNVYVTINTTYCKL